MALGTTTNFGNVTFNVIQNLPNYAVLNVPGPITTNNFGPLPGGASGSISLPPPRREVIDPDLKTAYARWNASAQRQFSRSIIYSLEYTADQGASTFITFPYPISGASGPTYSAIPAPDGATVQRLSQPTTTKCRIPRQSGDFFHLLRNK